MRIYILATLFFIISNQINARITADSGKGCYYIDFESGSDIADGKSVHSPWKHHPYMKNFSGTYSHTSGDSFIFKGGVTWTNESFPITIIQGGITEIKRDYYGIDSSWYKGDTWVRPIFDMQNKEVSDGNCVFILKNVSYVTLDNFEIINQYWIGAPVYGTVVTFNANASQYITIRNMYVHSWSYGAPAKDRLKIVLGQTSLPFNQGSILEHSEFENSADGKSGCGVYYWPIIRHCKFHEMSNAIISFGRGNKIYNDTIYDIHSSFDPEIHSNAIETGNSSLIYNNIIHDLDNGVMPIFHTPYGNDSLGYDSIYNNIVWSTGYQPPFSLDSDGENNASAGVIFFNNIAVATGVNACLRIVERNAGNIGYLKVVNNQFITDSKNPLCINDPGNCAGVDTLVNTNNLTQSHIEATADGYTEENQYAPRSDTCMTVDNGNNLVPSGKSDIRDYERSGKWDIGAYEYRVPLKINAPKNIRISITKN